MVRRFRYRRQARPNPKPYGFCCFPNDEILPRHGLDTSMISLKSLHECPALKIREQEIVKRPRPIWNTDGSDGDGLHEGSAAKLKMQSSSAGGINLTDMTESMIELMIDQMRAQRQAEYEARMDRLAAIGARKTKLRKVKKLKCGPPCWYADYSLAQLQHLKDLEDAMFKDKKENTTNRTAHCLASIGMTTDFVTVDPHVLRKLMNEYSTDVKLFIREVYKAIRGSYFEDEGIRLDYTTHERIMISGVVFLELPQIILELHKRMPPIIRFKFPPKPKAPQFVVAKKMISPLLEHLYPAVNWRLYATRMLKWRKKCSAIPRPVAILPKETKEVVDDNNEEIDSDQHDTKIEKTKVTADASDGLEKKSEVQSDRDNKSMKKDASHLSDIAEDHQSDTPLFTIENPWTEPPTACPMKYIKLLREKGPLKTDSEFFSQLNRQPCNKNQVSPSFRLQSILLEAEADLYGLVNEANELTGEVKRIAKEILEPDTGCDTCCSCKETRRAHLMMHATKGPYTVVDGIVVDDRNKTQVVGATAMHSPAESISSINEPACVPSTEKIVKNRIIAGTVTMVDGEPVNRIAGITKTLEHVPREILHPPADLESKLVKNVPPCGCRKPAEDEEFERQVLSTTKDEGLCYGKKFRPKEGPAYTCGEFGKKDEEEDCGCGGENIECGDEDECEFEDCFEEDDCGCGDDPEKCAEKDLPAKSSKKQGVICKRCGRQLDPKCVNSAIRKLRETDESGKKKKKVTNKCSCDSLSEFLQMDLGKTKCIMPKKIYHSKEKTKHQTKKKRSSTSSKSSKKTSERRVSRSKSERSSKVSQVVLKEDYENDEESSLQESVVEGGPFGLRTKSEEALPIERTLAYLVDPHPPNRPAERIPVREGGRPCRCRENRNNRKTLLYGIAGTLPNGKEGDGANATRVIEGLTWLTPEPSIRGSDEYIPEYELADSPYEKQICGSTKKSGGERMNRGNSKGDGKIGNGGHVEKHDGDRKNDWDNAIQDEHLTEFFTKDRNSIPCWTNCSKFQKKEPATKKLKVMKPVCECKYERRIVKRNEERKKWHDRQERLKSCNKEAFLHIDDIAKTELMNSCADRDVTVISAVTMQTPCETPQEGRSRSNLPYLVQVDDDQSKSMVDSQTIQKSSGTVDAKESSRAKSSKVDEAKSSKVDEAKSSKVDEAKSSKIDEAKSSKIDEAKSSKVDENTDEKEMRGVKKEVEVNEMKDNAGDDDGVVEIEFTRKMSRKISYFDMAEEELKNVMNAELDKIAAEENFISLKLPFYNKISQLSYWISYRVRGMCFTEEYKRALMEATDKIWNSKILKGKPSIESLRVRKKDRCKLNFDRAKYWKRKIAKLNRAFYQKARQDSVEIGREMWPTMEFGKFPHLLFKQAYFTYLPPREVDIYAFRTYAF